MPPGAPGYAQLGLTVSKVPKANISSGGLADQPGKFPANPLACGRSLSVDEGRYLPELGSVITLMAIGCGPRDRHATSCRGDRHELGPFNSDVFMQLTHKRASGVSRHYVTVGSSPAVLCLHGWPQNHRVFLSFFGTARTAICSSRGCCSNHHQNTGDSPC